MADIDTLIGVHLKPRCMRVRDWEDIVSDVVESNVNPEYWRAVAGTREHGVGEDLYLGHPDAGLYHLKTYAKNPFNVKGVGTQVARRLDDEIGSHLPEDSAARFAVQQPPRSEADAKKKARRIEETIRTHADAPTSPDALFDDLMAAIESPAYGPMDYDVSDRPAGLSELSTTFKDAENLLDTELETLIEEDEINKGFL